MMKVNDFLRYDIKLKIDYDDYFRLIYDTKYLIEARLGPNRTFIATKAVYGNSRKKAVQQAVQWFWKDFKGILGSAYKIMTITDPYDEVDYDENFACNDLGNKYLDESTLSRLIEDSNGDLARDESEGSEKHPPNSVKRTKRRRKQNVQLTTRLSQSPGGTIYYKMIDIADKVKNARPKVKMVKLSSKSLEKAVREVERRGLDKFEKFDTKTKSSRVSKGKVKQAA
ncbi:MAG: hypothetical protein HOH60_09180 [Opitutae bacterium]|jgi:hypothetical protein|nr:hypothetical protein [Opitutae bacterium]MBT5916508.1 hypothetical protein [Opitutae bacterium]MBT7406620.1 hypothetical protein [Opitutae bacterium]